MVTSPAFGAARQVCVTTFFGALLCSRYGYELYALNVRPPPQGFSHASFSSIRTVSRPALANRSAANEPAGPPPSTTTFFIWVALSWFSAAVVDVREVAHPRPRRQVVCPSCRADSHRHRRPLRLRDPRRSAL